MKQYISKQVLSYYNEIVLDNNHRYKSWEHCYNCFCNEYSDNKDIACLHLAFYLASWGMYRGSSLLLQKDYKFLLPIIDVCRKYQYLKYESIDNVDYAKGLLLIKRDLIKSFNIVNQSPSNTLITKIILGTLGIIPAYDRLFIIGIKAHGFKNYSFNIKSINEIVDFAKNNFDELIFIQKKIKEKGDIDFTYPIMKIIDMFFWQEGFDIEKRVR